MFKSAVFAAAALSAAAVAQVPSGIWVNTGTGNRLNKIDPGSSVSDFAANGVAQGIAVGVDGRVYSVSNSTDRLMVFSSTGALLNSVATADQPFGIAVASNHVWVSCQGGRLQRFSLDGSTHETYVTDQGARDVAVDNVGQIWVASRWNDVVIRYDGNGVEQARVPVGDGPTYLEATPYGELLCVNHHDCTIDSLCIKSDVVIDGGSYNGFPSDLTVDTHGNIWISLYQRNRIQFFDRLFNNGREISTGRRPEGISVDFDNNIWVACADDNQVRQYDGDGNPIQTYNVAGSPIATGDMSGVMALIHADPLGDADGDQHLNRAEWVSCSDLLDATDVPIEITATRNGAGVDLTVRENHHSGSFYFFYLTTAPLPGTNIGFYQGGVDPRIIQADINEMLFWNSILTPLPGLLVNWVGVTNGSGEATARANFPSPIPGLYVGAFTMSFDLPPTLTYIRSLSLATLLN